MSWDEAARSGIGRSWIGHGGIRRMAAGDLDRVLAIAATLATAPHWDLSMYEKAVSGSEDLRRIAIVAESHGVVIGFAVAFVIPPEAELESIAVAAEAQRTGVGAALMTALAAHLREQGVETLDLEVRASNGAALGLYERAGFRETGRRNTYYRDPVEDALVLRLELNRR